MQDGFNVVRAQGHRVYRAELTKTMKSREVHLASCKEECTVPFTREILDMFLPKMLLCELHSFSAQQPTAHASLCFCMQFDGIRLLVS